MTRRTKADLEKEIATLRDYLVELKDVVALKQRLLFAERNAKLWEERVDRQAERIKELEETAEHVEDGSYSALATERREALEILGEDHEAGCEQPPGALVAALKALDEELGASANDMEMVLRARELSSADEERDEYEKRAEDAEAEAAALEEALDLAVADRRALLARLGLTDAQWSASGGACWADLEVQS